MEILKTNEELEDEIFLLKQHIEILKDINKECLNYFNKIITLCTTPISENNTQINNDIYKNALHGIMTITKY